MQSWEDLWSCFWKVFKGAVRSVIDGSFFYQFHPLMVLAIGLPFCIVGNDELRSILSSLQEFIHPQEKLIKSLFPEKICYGTSWYVRKEEKEERIRRLGIVKSYEDTKSRTKDILPAPTAMLEVQKSIEKALNIPPLRWDIDREEALKRMKQAPTLLFGGPVSNEFSEWLLKEVPLEFNLRSRNYELIERLFNEQYEPEYCGGTYKSDFGVIIRKRTSFAPKGVIGLMGCHGYGTLACAKVISDENFSGAKRAAKEMLKLVEKDKEFYLIMEVEVDRGYLEKVEVVRSQEL